MVRTTMSAVCGSDLHNYRQAAEKLGGRANRVAGHEAVGVVESVGPGVEDPAPGTRVVVYQHYGCGRCGYCRTGEPMFCPERQTLGNHIDGADALTSWRGPKGSRCTTPPNNFRWTRAVPSPTTRRP
jgi:threonine dehydrogenase-like Zn-dependent dehydrogenase